MEYFYILCLMFFALSPNQSFNKKEVSWTPYKYKMLMFVDPFDNSQIFVKNFVSEYTRRILWWKEFRTSGSYMATFTEPIKLSNGSFALTTNDLKLVGT